MQLKFLPVFVPLLGLILLAVMGVLYRIEPGLYRTILTTAGMNPFRYPFLDWEYIGAGAKCWKQGVDVYIDDPCDVLNRVHGYSPLWLRATFIPTGRPFTVITGTALDSLFMLSLFVVFKPANWQEVIIFALGATSTMVVFALERANVDVILFLMIVAAGVLQTGPVLGRIASYALLLFAGLLKFYPLIALGTALRERPRIFFSVAITSVLIILAFLYGYWQELAAMSRNIPNGGAFGDLFGATNLLSGIASTVQTFAPVFCESTAFKTIQIAFIVLLLLATAAQAWRFSRNHAFVQGFAALADRDRTFLTIGSALIAGCFFTGQSIEYRGVYLLFLLSGLVALHRLIDTPTMKAKLLHLSLIVVLLMWEGLFRHLLAPEGILSPRMLGPFGLFWLIRELLWWYLAAVMLAVLATFVLKSGMFISVHRRWFRHHRENVRETQPCP
jgi:hypothetical protein